MATLEILEQRVTVLEQEITQLKSGWSQAPAAHPPRDEPRGARLIREAEQGRAAVVAASEKVLAGLGIQGQPIGAKKLRELLIADGIDPNDNAFSRELIAMREE